MNAERYNNITKVISVIAMVISILALAIAVRGAPIIECVGGEHAMMSKPALQITKMTDIAVDIGPAMFDKITTYTLSGKVTYPYQQGLSNGYSKYSNVNSTGKYFIAFSHWGNGAWLYRIVGGLPVLIERLICPYDTSSNPFYGESGDPRWSRDPAKPYTIIYHRWEVLFEWDVRDLQDKAHTRIIRKFEADIKHEGHMDQSGRYRSVMLKNGTAHVIDLQTSGAPSVLTFPNGGYANDVSSSGKFYFTSGYSPSRFFEIGRDGYNLLPSLARGQHDGWAFITKTNKETIESIYISDDATFNFVPVEINTTYNAEVYVWQDRDDWIKAFVIETGETIRIINMSEMAPGSHVNMHFGRMPASRPGWIFVSTYGWGQYWSGNQFFLLEIEPTGGRASRRIIRLGNTTNLYHRPDLGVEASYHKECWASITDDGNYIYFAVSDGIHNPTDVWMMDISTVWPDEPQPEPTPPPVRRTYKIIGKIGTHITLEEAPLEEDLGETISEGFIIQPLGSVRDYDIHP